MRVAVTGPLNIDAVAPYLDDAGSLPAGLGSTSVSRLVTGLLERDRRVTVVTCDPSVTVGDQVVRRGENVSLHIGPYRSEHRARDAFRVERRFVRDVLRREEPDVVHAHWSYEYALGALASEVPALVTFRDWAPTVLWHHRHPYRFVRLLMSAATLVRARHVTAVSPYLQRRVRRWVRRPVAVVPNGLPDACFERSRRSPNLTQPVIIAVNQGFGRRKNVHTLLAAFARFRRVRPASRLVLLGSMYESGGPAHRWAAERGLHERVEFGGETHRREVLDLMRSADLLVHPSREEAFGNVLVEAMGQGLPVVAGRDSGAVPWVLDEGRAGVLTEVTSARALADTIGDVLGDPGHWQDLSRAGIDNCWRRFRLERTLDAYTALYDTMPSERS